MHVEAASDSGYLSDCYGIVRATIMAAVLPVVHVTLRRFFQVPLILISAMMAGGIEVH
jgi:hypothetical protein